MFINNNDSKLLKSALAYATKFNFSVIPLHWIENSRCSCGQKGLCSEGKHPLTKNGVKDATKDITQIIKWWNKWPNANIGIACGVKSDIFVVDVDVDNTIDGHDTLKDLENRYGKLPNTPMQLTGSGGTHYIFKNNVEIKNLVKFLPGLDIRAEDGYILGAPSSPISGKEYIWEVNSHILDVPIVEAPNWLLNIARQYNKKVLKKRPSTYWVELFKGTSEGNRNNGATSLTGYLFRKYLDIELICEIVEMWNERNVPPLSQKELESIVISVAKLEAKRRFGKEMK